MNFTKYSIPIQTSVFELVKIVILSFNEENVTTLHYIKKKNKQTKKPNIILCCIFALTT